MTREIRIFLNQPEPRGPSVRASADRASERELSELVASIRRALAPAPALHGELGPRALEVELGARPLFSAVLGADAAPPAAAGVELLHALARIDARLDLDVTFVPER